MAFVESDRGERDRNAGVDQHPRVSRVRALDGEPSSVPPSSATEDFECPGREPAKAIDVHDNPGDDRLR